MNESNDSPANARGLRRAYELGRPSIEEQARAHSRYLLGKGDPCARCGCDDYQPLDKADPSEPDRECSNCGMPEGYPFEHDW